ncbi:MAG: DUF4910 domain-containing protein [Lachnospiraceae bacterium]|nr:DUF4910 domain-containing protein [Lachnospiraceae bacterium]
MSHLDIGREMYELAGKIFPLCRSLTGEGVRGTLGILSDFLKKDGLEFIIHEVPSGTEVFDWTVPKEWRIREAYIEDDAKNKIIDMKDNNLHVMGYSTPVDRLVSLDELKKYVYTQADQPAVIPYVTSYYKERYGFCMSQNCLDALPEGRYHMYIDSELTEGSMTYAELILPGKSSKEIMVTSYICHPSMANNECSGPVVLAELIKYVKSLGNRRYTYRFVFNPETIGAITYLSRNLETLKEKLVAGVVLSCVGDDRDYSIIHSRYGNTIADRSLLSILKEKEKFSEYSFLDRGSDERQYNAPGVDLPVVGFCRSKYNKYPEYHTSADDMNFISPEGLAGAYDTMVQWIDCMEANEKYKMTVLCEPQLGKRGLYPTVSQKGFRGEVTAMFNYIAYADGSNDLFEISRIIGVPPYELIGIQEKLKENGLIKAVEVDDE